VPIVVTAFVIGIMLIRIVATWLGFAKIGTHFADIFASFIPAAKGLAIPIPGIRDVLADRCLSRAEN
jgi:hypothetical protein